MTIESLARGAFPRLRVGLAGFLVLLSASPSLRAQAADGKKHALLVGIKEYKHHKLAPLRFTENDVTDLAGLLRPAGYEVTLLTDAEGKKANNRKPTVANIRAVLKQLLKDRDKHDTVLVALAGHGLQMRIKEGGREKDQSFFCPSDAQLNDKEKLISLKQLFEDLDECGAGVKLLLVDACRNEVGDAGMRNLDADSVPRPPKGIAALFSCASGQVAFESAKLGKGHGVFFHFVLEALKGDAKDEEGEVDWANLARFVTRQVSRRVPGLIGGGARQTPHEVKNIVGGSPVLLKIAAASQAEESYRRGLRLLLGQDGTIDEAEAVKQFQRAAEAGYARAWARLAVCLRMGIGAARNEALAVEYARKALRPVEEAANADDAAAQALLGMLYHLGLGVERDDRKAVELFRKAAANGDASAMLNLGVRYDRGRGVEKDVKEATRWYRSAAEKGHAGAMVNLGVLIAKKNDREAFEWYERAALKGHVRAMCVLGLCYEDGSGVKKDEKEALRWYRKAADRGNALAMYRLGQIYENGVGGVAKDLEEALKWYRKAAGQGNKNAREAVTRLEK